MASAVTEVSNKKVENTRGLITSVDSAPQGGQAGTIMAGRRRICGSEIRSETWTKRASRRFRPRGAKMAIGEVEERLPVGRDRHVTAAMIMDSYFHNASP
jgi:hypothetical protein